MLVIGLTGSIATGKSEVAKLLAGAGVPVFDADAEVHAMYKENRVTEILARHFPGAVIGGEVDRQALGKIVMGDPAKLKTLEALIHPLVRSKREEFIAKWKQKNARFVVLDIPLLYETGQAGDVDFVVVVSAPEYLQRERALLRPGMTDEKLAAIRLRQLPDFEKRSRADFVIENSGGLDQLREHVGALVARFEAMSREANHERNRP